MPEMSNQEIWRLIQKNITGNALKEEQRRLELWMNQNPENKKLVMEVKKIWSMTPEEKFQVDVQQSWKLFYEARIQKHQTASKGAPGKKLSIAEPVLRTHTTNSDRLTVLFKVAALLLVAVMAGYFVYAHLSDSQSGLDVEPIAMEELITGKGEKARVRFSDGTEMILNAASSLKFPREFKGGQRVVYLDGEAFFKVETDSGFVSPFIVHSHGVEVEVLGTEFNVRGWKLDNSVEVVVRQGNVSVNTPDTDMAQGERVLLNTGFQTIVINGQAPSIPREVNIRNRLAWVNGGLHFDNTPFSYVINDLERRFDVKITVKDEAILDIPFTSTFQYAELNEILSVISAAMEVEYYRDGSVIVFL